MILDGHCKVTFWNPCCNRWGSWQRCEWFPLNILEKQLPAFCARPFAACVRSVRSSLRDALGRNSFNRGMGDIFLEKHLCLTRMRMRMRMWMMMMMTLIDPSLSIRLSLTGCETNHNLWSWARACHVCQRLTQQSPAKVLYSRGLHWASASTLPCMPSGAAPWTFDWNSTGSQLHVPSCSRFSPRWCPFPLH